MDNPETIENAINIRESLAGDALTKLQARLYSQKLQLDMAGKGLRSFQQEEIYYYLDQAMLLIDAALIERVSNTNGRWQDGIKRAAEILEWLSQPKLRPPGPMQLLAAGAYQLAGFPAMALGHLERFSHDTESELLASFLRTDFPKTLQLINAYWHDQQRIQHAQTPMVLTTQIFSEFVRCLGVIINYLRTGDNELLDRAQRKLRTLSKSFLYSRDAYSFLLATLVSEAADRFVATALWPHIDQLRELSTRTAADALTQYSRAAFINRRSLVWPAQEVGIRRLENEESFVMCTPTGSGKTSIATLAILQSLFADPPQDIIEAFLYTHRSLALYLVPSRALAAEVETRLSQDLRGVSEQPVLITGLYGGIDWGPTDAWIDIDRPAVLICTFEKADALLRYLGTLFLDRLKLVVVDEAHMVEFNQKQNEGLRDGTSRSLRLEELGARLLTASDGGKFRIIALSAVAAKSAPALSRWLTSDADAIPATSAYRSTRQMLGRLEVSNEGRFTIHYELMDGHSLRFDEERSERTPYVRDPFPSVNEFWNPNLGPEVRMRVPTLWAALHLAAKTPDGSKPSVLISLTQDIHSFAKTCADMLDTITKGLLPDYFEIGDDPESWERCLESVADYFSVESVEYRLLKRGIAVHHGKLPPLLARRLKVLIERGDVRVIIATSTLSEGVNLPINYLLIPSLCRGSQPFTLQEFTNLIGRAGRPGVSTEGSALIMLPERMVTKRYGVGSTVVPNRQWSAYEHLIGEMKELEASHSVDMTSDQAASPLTSLLLEIEKVWLKLNGGASQEQFLHWLETTIVTDPEKSELPEQEYLNSLDSFLIAAIHELEALRKSEVASGQLEQELTRIWHHTYAYASGQEEARLANIWMTRGMAIKNLYPDSEQRARIYRTSLAPNSALTLFKISEDVRLILQTGDVYVNFSVEEKLGFIVKVLEKLSLVPSFKIGNKSGKTRFDDWTLPLRWWLAKATLEEQPSPNKIANWYDFVSQNFIYKGAWGLGSLLGMLLDKTDEGIPIQAIEISDWPKTDLPWIAFWIKELINWGTLDPVAAFLLARGDAINRKSAEETAKLYYDQVTSESDPNEILDPRRIGKWVYAQRVAIGGSEKIAKLSLGVKLVVSEENYYFRKLPVFPLRTEGGYLWIDVAGHAVATSGIAPELENDVSELEFELEVGSATVTGRQYLKYL